jgi:hypothetical protein
MAIRPSAAPRAVGFLLAALLVPSASAFALPGGAQALRAMAGQDHFAAEPGTLYTGFHDPAGKAGLNAAIDAAAAAAADAADAGASDPRLLAILVQRLRGIDRTALDTEDAERVAASFERMLEALGLPGSEGALDEWLYGFDPA